jgi:hypothetical protein
LLLPSVSTTIFQAYRCENIDPDGEDDEDDDWFLAHDYTISCSSDRYNFGVAWATVMIFVYPIGVTSSKRVTLTTS